MKEEREDRFENQVLMLGQRPEVFMLSQEAWCEPGLGWKTRHNCKVNFSVEVLKHPTFTRPTPRGWRH